MKSWNEIAALLRPHQQKSVERLLGILRSFDSAVDASETGVGKTFVGCAAATALQIPTLVVVPKISVTSWHRAAEVFGEKFSVIGYEKLRTGNTPYGSWEHQDQLNGPAKVTFFCEVCQRKFERWEDCDPCPYNAGGIHCFDTRKKLRRYGRFIFHPAVKFAVFDEAHRLGGLDSLNADMLFAAKNQKIKHLLLSATLAQSPLGLNAIGYSLDLHAGPHDDFARQLPNFYRWAARYGVRRDPAFKGLKWFAGAERQKQVMSEIRASIAARSVRVTCDEIPGFQEQLVTADLFDLDDPEKAEKLLFEMRDALQALDDRKANDKDSEFAITKILRTRQNLELLKVPIFVELAQDVVNSDRSACIFVNFKQTVDELSMRLKCPFIDGTVTGQKRQQAIEDFQANKIRCLVLNSAAGGLSISLHDITGNFPRVGFISPSFSAIEFRQVLGRTRREGGKSISHFKVVLAAGTLETQIKAQLDRKLANIEALSDEDFLVK